MLGACYTHIVDISHTQTAERQTQFHFHLESRISEKEMNVEEKVVKPTSKNFLG